MSLRAVTSRDLRFLGRRGRVRGLPGLPRGSGALSPALLPPQSPPKKPPAPDGSRFSSITTDPLHMSEGADVVQPGGSPSGDRQAGEGQGQPAARRGGRRGSAPGSRTGLGTPGRMRREQGWGVPQGPSPSATAGVPPGRGRKRRRGRGGGAGAALSRCGPGTGIASVPAATGPGGRPPPRSALPGERCARYSLKTLFFSRVPLILPLGWTCRWYLVAQKSFLRLGAPPRCS